jgi:predicted transcriptional regulator
MTEPAVHKLFEPDAGAMREHLEHLFGGFLDGFHDGLVELAWTDVTPNADGRYALRHASLFGTDQIEPLIAEAVKLNRQTMCNVYVGAALRKPKTWPNARASAGDVLALTCAYADLDDQGVASVARKRWGATAPTKIVITGREPYLRAQLWWRLDEPITDQKQSETLLKGIAAGMAGDTTVSDPPRVMRLAGSIAWPMKPDRKRPEITSIAHIKEEGQPIYTIEHLRRTFPFAAAPIEGVVTPDIDGIHHATTVLGLDGKVDDGRERYMLQTANAVLIELIGTSGQAPTAQQLFDAAWPQYERSTDLTRSGRGADEFAKKCAYTVKRFAEGKIRGCETIEVVQALYRQRTQARGTYTKADPWGEFARSPPQPTAPGGTFRSDKDAHQASSDLNAVASAAPALILTAEQFVSGFTPPAYIIDGIMQRGYLYSLTARTGHGKTAVAMYIAQCIARGETMHGRKVKCGTVLLLAGENPDDIRARFLVLAEAYSFDAASLKMRFVAGVIDIAAQMPVIAAAAGAIDDLILVIVDTAAAYFLGDETNSNAQQGAFARVLRRLTMLPGLPAVLVNCHPVKNATQDNLLPMGGSAFTNEVDGNLTLWADAEKQTSLHWLGKFRGPEFDPITFELKIAESPKVHDVEGRLMPSVVAVPIAEMVLEASQQRVQTEGDTVLNILTVEPGASFNRIAERAGFVNEGRPNKSKVQRLMKNLEDFKLVEKHRNKRFYITEKGKKELEKL